MKAKLTTKSVRRSVAASTSSSKKESHTQDRFGSPLCIDFETCDPVSKVPPGWCTEDGGKKAAKFAYSLKLKDANDTNLTANKFYWSTFRLLGTVTLEFDCFSPAKAKSFQKHCLAENIAAHGGNSPWTKEGDPNGGGMQRHVSSRRVLEAISTTGAAPVPKVPGNDDDEEEEKEEDDGMWQTSWLEIATQLNQPGGQWSCPFVLPLIPRTEITVNGNIVTIPARLYVCRLLFYLIADEALATLMRPLKSVGMVIQPRSVADSEDGKGKEATFTRGTTSSSPFSVTGIMRSMEHTGYKEAKQPQEISLIMKPYQLQTLQWMLDQEQLPQGLNGCFWETWSWVPDNDLHDLAQCSYNDRGEAVPLVCEDAFYVSTELGEFRLEKPPLVRGGMLCEEMGLGKTLELVALIMSTRKEQPASPRVMPKKRGLVETQATLIVVPDTLVGQWVQEIRKSCINGEELKVVIYPCDSIDVPDEEEKKIKKALSLRGDPGTTVDYFVNCDICLTTFRTVEMEKQKLLQKVMWRRVVIDEMQMIRSSTTKVAKSCENLSSHARWMVSGTPLYTSVKDLNGLLNFLHVIPFSLNDTKDGFWQMRLGAPLAENDPDALLLLQSMLEKLMMRHSKAQKYVSGSLAGKSILDLPEMHKELVPISFDTYEEEAAYRHLEALGLRAALTQANSQEQPRQDRPAVIAVDLLRMLAVSPWLLTGGMGAATELNRVGHLWRALLSPTFGMEHGLTAALSEDDPFQNPIALPGDKVRDILMSRTAKSGGHKGTSQNDTALRLETAQQNVNKSRATISFEKAKSFEGLPWLRWKYAIKCVTSGRYHLLQLVRRRKPRSILNELKTKKDGEMARLFRNCPILARRACLSFAALRQYSQSQVQWDRQNSSLFLMEPEELMEHLRVSHEKRVVRQVQVAEGYSEEQTQLWFSTSEHADLPTKPPSLYDSLAMTTDQQQPRRSRKRRRAENDEDEEEEESDTEESGDEDEEESDTEESGDEDEDSGSENNDGAATTTTTTNASKLNRMRRSRRVAHEENGTETEKFDFFGHETFWRKAFAKCLMSRQFGKLKKDIEYLKMIWESTNRPGIETLSISQMIACRKANPLSLRFEAVFWYETTADLMRSKKHRAWVAVVGDPVVVDKTQGLVKFLDGQERLLDANDIRLVDADASLPLLPEVTPVSTPSPLDPFFIESATSTTSTVSAVAPSKPSALRDVLEHLNLRQVIANFADLIGKERDLDIALELPAEDLLKRLTTNNEQKAPAKVREKALASRLDRFRDAKHIWDAKQMKKDLSTSPQSVLAALKSTGKNALTMQEVKTLIENRFTHVKAHSNEVWTSLWRIKDNRIAEEPIDAISIILGLKGEILHPDLSARETVSSKELRELKAGDTVLTRLNGSEWGLSREFNGWFRAQIMEVPDFNDILKPVRFSLSYLGVGPIARQLIRAGVQDLRLEKALKRGQKGASSSLDEEMNADGEISSKKKKLKLDSADSPKSSSPASKSKKRKVVIELEEEEEEEAAVDEKEQPTQLLEPDSQEARKVFPNGMTRVRSLGNQFHATQTLKERIQALVVDIQSAKKTLPDLERFESLLLRAAERGGTAGVQLATQQGFQALEQLIERDSNVENPKCTICLDELSAEPVILGCLHLFCKECLIMQKKAHMATHSFYAPRALSCPLCRRTIEPSEMYQVLPVVKEDDTLMSTSSKKKKVDKSLDSGRKTSKSRYSSGDGRPPEWSKAVDDEVVKTEFSNLPSDFQQWDSFSTRFVGLPRTFRSLLRSASGLEYLGSKSKAISNKLSAKLRRVVQDVREADGKVVIFSQFAKSVNVLVRAFDIEKISAVKIARGDNAKNLSSALETFQNVDDCKVLILHSGSSAAGLTLTVARYVFLLEPFLRAGEEAQAINRVHRIGQSHSVKARCYYVRDTIEERILAWRNNSGSSSVAVSAAPRPRNGRRGSTPSHAIELLDDEDEDQEGAGLSVLAGDDQSKSIASLSNDFLSYVLGASNTIVDLTG